MADLEETVADGVATLTMNRPERRNALSPAMLEALAEALPRLAADPAVRALVLTGAGGAFSAGGDVKAMAERGSLAGDGLEEKAAGLRRRMDVSRLLHEMPKPVVAAIPGACAGASLSMALACDLRIAARGAKFTTGFANVGFSGDFGGSWFLTRIVGTARARDLYFTARVFDANEALALGVVNRVVAAEAFEGAVAELAGGLAAGPPIALRYMKRNLNVAETAGLAEALDLEALHHARTSLTEDHREAARAFAEKRRPTFRGR